MKTKLGGQIHVETVAVSSTAGGLDVEVTPLSIPDLSPGDAVVVNRVTFTLDSDGSAPRYAASGG